MDPPPVTYVTATPSLRSPGGKNSFFSLSLFLSKILCYVCLWFPERERERFVCKKVGIVLKLAVHMISDGVGLIFEFQ